MRLRFLLPAAIAATFSLVPAAHAAGWVSSGPLSPDDRVASEPQVVVTPSGERVIAWVQNLQNGFTPENVSVRVAPPGHDFGAAQTFAGQVDGPKLAVAADGTVALAWTESATRTVHIARMAPGQTNFVEATPLTVAGGETPFDVQLAFNGADAVAAFESSVDPVSTVWAARLPAGGGAVALDPGPATGGALDHASVPAGQPREFVDDPNIAADGGKIFVSWQRQTEGVLNNNGGGRDRRVNHRQIRRTEREWRPRRAGDARLHRRQQRVRARHDAPRRRRRRPRVRRVAAPTR